MGRRRPFNGYEYHVRRRAVWTPTGVAILVAAFGVSSFLMLLPPIQSKDAAVIANLLDWFIHFESRQLLAGFSFSKSHVSATFSLIALVIIGVAILRASHRDNEAFMSAYPYFDLSFTPEEIARARRTQRLTMGAGIAIIIGAVILGLLLVLFKEPRIGVGFGFCISAVGAWLIVHGFLADRVAQAVLYNYEALQRTSLYRIEQYYEGPEYDVVVAAKRRSMQTQAANRVIILIGVILALAMYFLPSLETPLYWVPLAVAFAVAGVNLHLAVRWVLGRIEESDQLKRWGDVILNGKSDGREAAFERSLDEIAEGVAEAEGAKGEPMRTSEAEEPEGRSAE